MRNRDKFTPVKYVLKESVDLFKLNKITFSEQIHVELRGTAEDSWSVVYRGDVVASDLAAEWEPSPSNRDDEFLKRTRFKLDGAQELALKFFKKKFSNI